MQAKLTLRLEEQLIERAKAHAKLSKPALQTHLINVMDDLAARYGAVEVTLKYHR